MKNNILQYVPDLYFIKKEPSGLYNLYLNYDWVSSTYSINFHKLKDRTYPHLYMTDTYHNIKKQFINFYIQRVNSDLAQGAKIVFAKIPKWEM